MDDGLLSDEEIEKAMIKQYQSLFIAPSYNVVEAGELAPVSLGEISITSDDVKIEGDELLKMVQAFAGADGFDFKAR